MNEYKTDKKCSLGFNVERILRNKEDLKKLESLITNPIPFAISKRDSKVRCIYKPRLSKSAREDLGYYYKKGKLYNLNHSEVPTCIFCGHYME